MSTLKVLGLSFPAFSGMAGFINKKIWACTPNLGPIPPGSYYIVDRQSGGILSAIRDKIWNHGDWFSLYANDGRIDDKTFCNLVERGNFRLHPKGSAGISMGCITVDSIAQFNHLRSIFKSIKPERVKGSDVFAYGKVIVR